MNPLGLPNYLQQEERVSARFKKLKEREVILEIKDLYKTSESPQDDVTALENINFKAHRR